MTTNDLAAATYRADLGDGLIARWSTAADTEQIGQLLATVHRDSPDEPLNLLSHDLTRELMSGRFPYMTPADFAVVEDASQPARPIVACTCLWQHTWRYADLPFGVGRPEYVATDSAYRNRGLVRALFDMIHARSAAAGHLLQAITGIAYFYRQFGYEYVLDLEGSRTVYLANIPERKTGADEGYRLRPAAMDDLPTLQSLYDTQRDSSLLWHEYDAAYWRWIVEYWDDPTVRSRPPTTLGIRGRYWLIEDAGGRVVGSTWARTRRWDHKLHVTPTLASGPDVDQPAVAQALLRLLRDLAAQVPGADPEVPPCRELLLRLGREHPLYELIGEQLALRVERPYAWYIRVPDVAAFLRHITPVLEERLARSVLAGRSCQLTLDLYRSGLKLHIEQGKLVAIEPWRAAQYGYDALAAAPPLIFLQLLLSYRSLDELRAIYPDVWVAEQAKVWIDTLFPKLASNVVEPLI